MAAGRVVQPLQVVTDIPGGGDVIAYQAVLADEGVYAVKVSPYLPQADGSAIETAWTLLLSLRTGSHCCSSTPRRSLRKARRPLLVPPAGGRPAGPDQTPGD